MFFSLQFYIGLLVVFLLEVIAIVVFFVLKEQARAWAADLFTEVYIKGYHNDEESLADFFQETVSI